MVNFIWLLLLVAGILVAAMNGNVGVVTEAALGSAQSAVRLALELIGLMALWLGLLKIAEDAGMVRALARLVRPLARVLFPTVPREHPAIGAMVMNLSANMLGMGNAATPFGLKAMQELQALNPDQDTASEAMCTFLALNTACITLLPATIIGIRAIAGSSNPTEIVAPTIIATGCGTLTALIADNLFRRWHRRGV